jgi:hypothetical protein
MGGAYTIQGEMRNRYRILAGESPGTISVGTPGRRWEAVANIAV